MVRVASERVLLIGDGQRQIESVLAQTMPLAEVRRVETYFDGIAELSADEYTAVLAAVEPIERRPEAAVQTIRQLAPEARVVLFGHPTLEPLSRKMLEFGCDDYLITPASAGEIEQVFGTPRMLRLSPGPAAAPGSVEEAPAAEGEGHPLLAGLPLAELIIEALSEQPHNATAEAVRRVNLLLGPAMELVYAPAGTAPPAGPADGRVAVAHAVRAEGEELGQVHLLLPRDEDANAARHFLSRLSDLLGKLQALQERHVGLQKLAITDDLTSLYNARYFRHFLSRILERARAKRFPVTLFIFDIDNLKQYNDRFGHGMGDQILKQTAALMRRCCREHDLVARIGGDEFAVVFWEKEGPRQPKEPKPGPAARTPQTPLDILERFRKLLATQEYPGLGPNGQGILTISGGLAVYPFDAQSMDDLIKAADEQLVFKAKQSGKNCIFLVGEGEVNERR